MPRNQRQKTRQHRGNYSFFLLRLAGALLGVFPVPLEELADIW
jgi:hypothetical protein